MKSFLLTLFFVAVTSLQTSNANEQPIASVFEQKIYQSDLKNEDGSSLTLQRVIIPRLLDRYKEKNEISFEPSPQEIKKFKIWFNKNNKDDEQESKENT